MVEALHGYMDARAAGLNWWELAGRRMACHSDGSRDAIEVVLCIVGKNREGSDDVCMCIEEG